jgi:Zn-finger nucleic acid-binding protein
MNCPACNVPLAMSDRQGVEIDYCPRCRGVWLDRGEIDKIVEREVAAYGPMPRREAAPPMPEGPFYRDDRDHDDRYRYDDKYRKKKKRESFLEDLFDFG